MSDARGSSSRRRAPGARAGGPMTLREQVERALPNWDRWYPSLFEAARDLGLIRATVCAPSSLLLSNRHADVRRAAAAAHREKWGGTEDPPAAKRRPGKRRRRKA